MTDRPPAAKKSPPGVWFKRYGQLPPDAKRKASITRSATSRAKKLKITLAKP